MYRLSFSEADVVHSLADQQRPVFPDRFRNPELTKDKAYEVKSQEILRDAESIIIARIKVPTPIGHALILRRLDTGAISLTTMLRAAFPSAPSNMLKDECRWIRANHNLSNATRSGRPLEFRGTWIPAPLARTLAPSYRLNHIIDPLLAAQLTPNIEFRQPGMDQQSSTLEQVSSLPATPSPVYEVNPLKPIVPESKHALVANGRLLDPTNRRAAQRSFATWRAIAVAVAIAAAVSTYYYYTC